MGTMKDGNDTKPEVIRDVLRESVDYSLGKIPNIFDGFPVVGTLVTILKTYNTIRETIFKKRVLRFLQGCEKYNEQIKEKIQESLTEPEEKEELAELLIICLEKFENIKKADILAKLFLARIYRIISKSEFEQLTLALEKINYDDVELLVNFYKGYIPNKNEFDTMRTFLSVKLISVDYSGRPETGWLWPRDGGGAERFLTPSGWGNPTRLRGGVVHFSGYI